MNNIVEMQDNINCFYYGACYRLCRNISTVYKNIGFVHYINHMCHGDSFYKSLDEAPVDKYLGDRYFAQTPIKCNYRGCLGISNLFIIRYNDEYKNKLKEFMKYNSNKYEIILMISDLLPELLIIIQREFFYILLNKI